MTLASALAPPEQLSVEGNSLQGVQPRLYSLQCLVTGDRKGGPLAGVLPALLGPFPGAFSLESTFSMLPQQLAF